MTGNGLPRVVVAMSGGVDSSVAAALLVQQGYPVTGMMLRLWSEEGSQDKNRCCTPDAMAAARRVAAQLDIPLYAIDAQGRFHDIVVQHFIEGYASGDTPNPCTVCNRHIRWGLLMDRARALGAEYLATGHYARVLREEDRPARLLRGVDPGKDQSYVLSVLSPEQLAHTLLPVGGFHKADIRELARGFGFAVADRPDSQDLCFLAGSDYRDFLLRHAPALGRPGPIVNRRGEPLGVHQGLAFYTIGQRKGIGIAAAQPLYVLDKDMERNALVVGVLEELGRAELLAAGVTWLTGSAPAETFRAMVKIRYRAKDVPALVQVIDDTSVRVTLDAPARDITPGQRVVFYQDDECLGGGSIQPWKGDQK